MEKLLVGVVERPSRFRQNQIMCVALATNAKFISPHR